MSARQVFITSPYIALDQLLKWAGLVMTGGEARSHIQEGRVLVNGEPEIRRGKKLRDGDKVSFLEFEVEIKASPEA
jgi:ribosome-associated protein